MKQRPLCVNHRGLSQDCWAFFFVEATQRPLELNQTMQNLWPESSEARRKRVSTCLVVTTCYHSCKCWIDPYNCYLCIISMFKVENGGLFDNDWPITSDYVTY